MMPVIEWCEHHGVDVFAGLARLHKVVTLGYRSMAFGPTGRVTYPLGTWVSAPDWRDDPYPGGGLHFFASPSDRIVMHDAAGRMRLDRPYRRLALLVPVLELRPLITPESPQAKAPRAYVAAEVTP